MGSVAEKDSIIYTRLGPNEEYAVFANVFRTPYNKAVYGDPYDDGAVTVNLSDPSLQTAVTVYEGDTIWLEFGAYNAESGLPGNNPDIDTSGSFTVTGFDSFEFHDYFGTNIDYLSHQFIGEVEERSFSGSFFLRIETGGEAEMLLNDGPNVSFLVYNNGTGDGQPQTIDIEGYLANPDYDILKDALVGVGAAGKLNYIDLPDVTRADLPWNYAEMEKLRHRGDDFDGTEDEDAINAGGGNDLVRGFGANDRIFGASGRDTLLGGAGLDLLDGGKGHDTLNGGTGDDRLLGQLGDDLLRGQGGHDDLFGHGGEDRLIGGGGNDELFGGGDNDRLKGNGGFDKLFGGNGRDGLNGGGGNDFLYGQGGRDTMNGGKGADKVYGGGGNDRVGGRDGLDVLYGGGGNDLMNGGKGMDALIGGRGSDNLIGGKDGDFFIFRDNDGRDTIQDYNFSFEFDVIQIAGSAQTYEDLIIRDSGDGGTTVTWEGGTTIVLAGYDPSEVHQGFFLFDQNVMF